MEARRSEQPWASSPSQSVPGEGYLQNQMGIAHRFRAIIGRMRTEERGTSSLCRNFLLFVDQVPMCPLHVGKMATGTSKFTSSELELSNCTISPFHKSHPSAAVLVGMKVNDWLSLGLVFICGKKANRKVCYSDNVVHYQISGLLSNKLNCLRSREINLES